MQNRNFRRILRMLRNFIPYGSVALLIAVYAVSSLLHGAFLSSFSSGVAYGTILAYSMGVVIQVSRGVIVFFGQSNPTYPDFGRTGEIVAIILAIVAIGELTFLANEGAVPVAFAVSGAILMGIGAVDEIFLLREVQRATKQELFENPDIWQGIERFATAEVDLLQKLDDLEDRRNSAAFFNKKPGVNILVVSPELEERCFYVAAQYGAEAAKDCRAYIEEMTQKGAKSEELLGLVDHLYPVTKQKDDSVNRLITD